jgi:hypothetical protein
MASNTSVLEYAAGGALAGVEATGTMTAAIGVAQRLGLLGRFPPKKIVNRALAAAGIHHRTSEPARHALTALAHLGFGLAAGALFGMMYRRTRNWPAPAPVQGALYGAAVWALSYHGWVPALGIMPPPERDRPGRPTTMFLSHLVYGAKLGANLQARSL